MTNIIGSIVQRASRKIRAQTVTVVKAQSEIQSVNWKNIYFCYNMGSDFRIKTINV